MRASVASVTGGLSESRSCRCVYMAAVYYPLLQRGAAAQRIVVEAAPPHPPDGRQQLVIIRRVVDGIDRGRVDDEKRRRIELMEEAGIRLVQANQVVPLDVLL